MDDKMECPIGGSVAFWVPFLLFSPHLVSLYHFLSSSSPCRLLSTAILYTRTSPIHPIPILSRG